MAPSNSSSNYTALQYSRDKLVLEVECGFSPPDKVQEDGNHPSLFAFSVVVVNKQALD